MVSLASAIASSSVSKLYSGARPNVSSVENFISFVAPVTTVGWKKRPPSSCLPPPVRTLPPLSVASSMWDVTLATASSSIRGPRSVLSQIWCSVGPSEATFWRSSWEVADDEQNGAGAISTRRFEDGTDRGLREHGGRACSRIERQIGVLALRSDLRSPAQQISEAAGRPSRSWSRRQDRSGGPAAPLPHTALPYTSVRGAVSAVGYAPAWPADLAVAGAGAPPRPGVGRTPGASPRGPPIAAGEQRHVPARRPCLVQRFRRRSAACDRHRRLGVATGPALRHVDLRPRAAPCHRPPAGSRARDRRSLAEPGILRSKSSPAIGTAGTAAP